MTNQTQDKMQLEHTPDQPKIAPQKSKMQLVLNIIFLCSIIILFALYFLGNKQIKQTEQGEEISQLAEKISDGKASIAYINSVQLMEEYELAKKLRQDFEAEQTRLDNDLSRRQRNFQTEVEKFQRDVQAGTISIERAQALERELMAKQQELVQLNEQYTNRLMQKEIDMNNELLEKISEFLGRYNQAYGFDYILGYTRGGGILYASQQHDITADVLLKLNAEFLLNK